MDKVRLFSDRHFGKGCILALGTFDGVHKGHRELLNKALEIGRQLNLSTGVFFFSAPPALYFSADFPGVLTLPEEKENIFRGMGFDFSVSAEFPDYREMTPDGFIDRIVSEYRCEGIVCGENFTFGKDCSGSLSMLRDRFGNASVIVGLHSEHGETVSSSEIRKMICDGSVDSANRLLYSVYSLSGKVIHGRHDGSRIGFPTANLQTDSGKAIPGRGVYITETEICGKKYRSVTDVGKAPTLTQCNGISVETHIPGFSEDIYGEKITVSFLHKIRDEIVFVSVEELKTQLKKDVDFLKNHPEYYNAQT